MTNEDIIRMAREAGMREGDSGDWTTADAALTYPECVYTENLERFANLVAAAERNRIWTQDHWTEYERSIVATEREACAKTVMEYDLLYIGSYPINEQFADAIRARGQK